MIFSNSKKNRRSLPIWIGIIFSFITILAACQSQNISESLNAAAISAYSENGQTGSGNQFLAVDCLLPPQVRKLGKMVYLNPRRPVKITAGECEIRGGEYVAYDRAADANVLAIWMQIANTGDLKAQTYVGDIYQKGIGVTRDYAQAAKWYRLAAEKGHKQAQLNLGFLYEKGIGVPQSEEKAIYWYRQATGMDAVASVDRYNLETQERAELNDLRQKANQFISEIGTLQNSLLIARQDLASTQGELSHSQAEIEQYQEEILGIRQKLDEQITLATGTSADKIENLKVDLENVEQAFSTKQRETEKITAIVKRQQIEKTKYQEKIAQLEKRISALPGPKIEVISPQIVSTRGIVVAQIKKNGKNRTISGRIWAPAGLSLLEVNGTRYQPGGNGTFKADIPLNESTPTRVSIFAQDANGKKETVSFTLSVEPTRGSPQRTSTELGAIDFGKYYALIIGNNNYQNLPKLETAVNDAKAMGKMLAEKYGFEVKILFNSDRYEILSTLNIFRKRLTEKDNLLIYYAGHGELVKENNQGYWLPVDADPEDTVNWLPTYQITDIMNLMSAKQIMVIADTCYSGSLTRSSLTRLESGKSEEEYQKWLIKLARYRSRIVLSSGEAKPVLDSGGGNHSVFAKSLLDVLGTNSKVLRGVDLHSKVASKVVAKSEALGLVQVPQYAGLTRAGHKFGDFLFVPTDKI